MIRPQRVSKLSVVELSGKPADCPQRVVAMGSVSFYLRSLFDPVMKIRCQNVHDIGNFLTSEVHKSNNINGRGR